MRDIGDHKKRTTPYHPSANGQVERINRTLLQMIRCTLKEGQTNWDSRLQMLVAAVRSSVNSLTGFTPNLLMLGREVIQPLQLMTGVGDPNTSIHIFVDRTQKEMQEAHELARQSLKMQQQRQKREYDIHARPSKYEVGDVVLLMNSGRKVGQSKKLAPLWKGPFVVVKVLTPVLCRIASSKKDWVVHNDRLRTCNNDPLPL